MHSNISSQVILKHSLEMAMKHGADQVTKSIDYVPSEIATASLRAVSFESKWNSWRTDDAAVLLSIGWMQVDNHCPNAPFPVAVCPDQLASNDVEGQEVEVGEGQEGKVNKNSIPFLSFGLVLAPEHDSGILCFKGVTI